MKKSILRIVSASVIGPLLLGSIAFAEEETETPDSGENTAEETTTEALWPTVKKNQDRKEHKKAIKKEAFEKLKGIKTESKEARTAAREKCKEEKTTIRKGFVEQVQTLTGKENKEARKTLKTTTKESLKATREGCKEERKAIRDTTKEKRQGVKKELKDAKKALRGKTDDDNETESGSSVLQSERRTKATKILSGKAAFRDNIHATDLEGAGRRTKKVPSARSTALDAKKRLKHLEKSAKKNPTSVEAETE